MTSMTDIKALRLARKLVAGTCPKCGRSKRDNRNNSTKANTLDDLCSRCSPSRQAEKKRRGKIKKASLGLDFRWFNKKADLQEFACAICGETEVDASGRGRTLCIDHNHDTDQIRDLLCTRCNTGIGQLREREDLFDAAKAYLRKHSAIEKRTLWREAMNGI